MSVPAAFLGLVVIWSTTPLAVKWSGEEVGFLFGVTSRMWIGVLLCWLLVLMRRQAFARDARALHTYFASSLGIFGSMLFVYWGASYIPSGLISVLFGFTPVVISILAAIWLNERSLTASKVSGLLLSLIGLAVIFSGDFALYPGAITGISLVLLAVSLHALSTVWVKRIGAHVSALSINTGGLTLAVVFFTLTWLIVDGRWPQHIPQHSGLSILYLGTIATLVGFSLYYYALKNMEANRLGVLPLITPVLALLIGQVFNQEHIELSIWIGAAMIAAGLILHTWGHRLRLIRQRIES